jgi:hypothetical protein
MSEYDDWDSGGHGISFEDFYDESDDPMDAQEDYLDAIADLHLGD